MCRLDSLVQPPSSQPAHTQTHAHTFTRTHTQTDTDTHTDTKYLKKQPRWTWGTCCLHGGGFWKEERGQSVCFSATSKKSDNFIFISLFSLFYCTPNVSFLKLLRFIFKKRAYQTMVFIYFATKCQSFGLSCSHVVRHQDKQMQTDPLALPTSPSIASCLMSQFIHKNSLKRRRSQLESLWKSITNTH